MQIFDWNATITEIATIIAAGATAIASFCMIKQVKLMTKQNENSAKQNENSARQNAESLTLQTKLALYKERKEFIIKLEEAYNLNISEVRESFKKNTAEISKFTEIQYKIEQFMGNYTNENLSEEDFQKRKKGVREEKILKAIKSIEKQTGTPYYSIERPPYNLINMSEENFRKYVKEAKKKALDGIEEIYEQQIKKYDDDPFYFIERPSKYLLNNLITESGLLFESKEVEKIKTDFQLLNENLDKFINLSSNIYNRLFAKWFKLARNMSLYYMYGLVFNNENPDAKYNELLKSWEEMEEVGGKIRLYRYFGFTKKESEYYIPPIEPLIELLRKEIKLLP